MKNIIEKIKTNFEKQSFTERLFLRFLPIQILYSLGGAIGSFFISLIVSRHLGVYALSAISLFAPIVSIIGGIGGLFASGTQIYMGHLIGKGQKKEADHILCFVTIILFIIGLLFSIFLAIFSHQFAAMLGANNEINELSNYILGMCFSFIFQLLCPLFIGYLQILGSRGRPIISMLIYISSSLVFNLIFVFALSLNTFGVGLATSIAQACSCIVLLTYLYESKNNFYFSFKVISFKTLGIILGFGLPSAIVSAAISIKGILINSIIIDVFDSNVLAVNGVLGTICSIIGSFSVGISSTVILLGSLYYGDKNKKELINLYNISMKYCLIISSIVALLFFALANPLSYAFFPSGSSQNIIPQKQTFQMIMIVSWFGIPNFIIFALIKFYNATNKIILASVYSALESTFTLAFVALFAYTFKENSVWIAYPVSGVFMLSFMYIYSFIKNKKISLKAEKVLMFDKSLDIPVEDLFVFHIDSIKSATKMSRELYKFCLDKNFEKKKSFAISLCSEELACNEVEHAFRKTKRISDRICEVVVTNESSELIVTFKDLCKAFDPLTYSNKDNTDPIKGTGIKLAKTLSDDIFYTYSAGTNILKLTFKH